MTARVEVDLGLLAGAFERVLSFAVLSVRSYLEECIPNAIINREEKETHLLSPTTG
jgi:hypothetical protein